MVATAYGLPFDFPVMGLHHAVRTPFATILPPGRRVVAILDNSGNSTELGNLAQIDVCSTLADALNNAKADRGDYIIVMPGHAEDVDSTDGLDNLVDGTRIVSAAGSSDQDDAPTFTWTAAAANWALDNDNVLIQGCRFMLNGDNNITEAISVTGAGCKMIGNYFVSGTGASLDCAKVVDIELGASNFVFAGNISRQSGGTTTSVLSMAAVVDGIVIANNDLQNIGSAVTAGPISISAAVTNLRILNNLLDNQVASATTCINITDVAATGMVVGNRMRNIVSGGTASANGITIAGTTNLLLTFYDNLSSDEAGKSGLLSPAAAS